MHAKLHPFQKIGIEILTKDIHNPDINFRHRIPEKLKKRHAILKSFMLIGKQKLIHFGWLNPEFPSD